MITVFGSINLDLVIPVETIPRPGETVLGNTYEAVPGGKGANQALAARRAGAAVRMVGAVGDDFFAEGALAILRTGGVDLECVKRTDAKTGLATISVDAGGENAIVVASGANQRVTADQLDQVTFGRNDLALFQLEVPLHETLAVAQRAKQSGARTILSVAPYRAVDVADLAEFDYLIMNELEAIMLAGTMGSAEGDAEQALADLASATDTIVVTTLGPRGARAIDGDRIIKVSAPAITAVDTTGAGDTFCGVLAAMLGEGANLDAALAHASAAGALSCTKLGAQTSFPDRAQIDLALNEYY